jgi:D-methionine transport system ATP-binding protein
LSGGQKQRVAIARALATRPKYLLCDEATSALDPNTTRSILDLIKQINREMGVTIIVITHEMKVIDSICDRVAVIDKSKIAELGKVSEVFTSPKSDIARELILPLAKKTEHISGGTRIRIVFDGEESTMPVISNLVLDCRVPVNIMYADTKDIDGKAFGQMVIEVENTFVSQVCDYLDSIKIKHEEVQ